jgi:hypothetical protein
MLPLNLRPGFNQTYRGTVVLPQDLVFNAVQIIDNPIVDNPPAPAAQDQNGASPANRHPTSHPIEAEMSLVNDSLIIGLSPRNNQLACIREMSDGYQLRLY